MPSEDGRVAVLLLKTKSRPEDAYEQLFASPASGKPVFSPVFVPVLEHRFSQAGLAQVKSSLEAGSISRKPDAAFGGLIFTSQRAVEAFSHVVGGQSWPCLQDVPVYSVGPATTHALRAVSQEPPLNIFGEHTGNGDKLAQFIQDHYGEWYADRPEKPPLLFLVGEQRRDIIPKTLTDPNVPKERRIPVTEVEVYETGVMESFEGDFGRVLVETQGGPARWVVVFSPTGCEGMLRSLGLLDEGNGEGKGSRATIPRTTFVATIGPTTANHLRTRFSFEPDVCSEQPSPEGLAKGITGFMKRR